MSYVVGTGHELVSNTFWQRWPDVALDCVLFCKIIALVYSVLARCWGISKDFKQIDPTLPQRPNQGKRPGIKATSLWHENTNKLTKYHHMLHNMGVWALNEPAWQLWLFLDMHTTFSKLHPCTQDVCVLMLHSKCRHFQIAEPLGGFVWLVRNELVQKSAYHSRLKQSPTYNVSKKDPPTKMKNDIERRVEIWIETASLHHAHPKRDCEELNGDCLSSRPPASAEAVRYTQHMYLWCRLPYLISIAHRLDISAETMIRSRSWLGQGSRTGVVLTLSVRHCQHVAEYTPT